MRETILLTSTLLMRPCRLVSCIKNHLVSRKCTVVVGSQFVVLSCFFNVRKTQIRPLHSVSDMCYVSSIKVFSGPENKNMIKLTFVRTKNAINVVYFS